MIPALAASFLALGSCSKVHELRAEMIEGRLAFVAVGDWWSRPDCFYSIDVEVERGPSAKPEAGDDAGRVKRGTYWSDWRASCENAYPVFFGQSLKGARYRDSEGLEWPHVSPKPLSPHVIYSASTLSPGSSYGTVYFRLNGDGGVQNLDWREAMRNDAR
ncbi:hypothetical protein [Novosphingobium sp. Rr 2-17]|uniref:hypothetical protein n=1 Tax=Novosphingobium sp. Rr 2-17 TaxID=555793 RepID=UPI001ED97BF5|nr:hypothetical protein [Novosphingobium sp. Rr 2-17]